MNMKLPISAVFAVIYIIHISNVVESWPAKIAWASVAFLLTFITLALIWLARDEEPEE